MRSLGVASCIVVVVSAVGCDSTIDCERDGTCGAARDALSLSGEAGELAGEPAVVLSHTSRGDRATDPKRRRLAVLAKGKLTLAEAPSGWTASGATSTPLGDGAFALSWTSTGTKAEAREVDAAVTLVLSGDRSGSFRCVAGVYGAVSCDTY